MPSGWLLTLLDGNVVGHIAVEKDDAAARVTESRFPNSIRVTDVADVSEEMVTSWALQFSQAGLVAIGAGPPCQGVSGLNASRKGALRDAEVVYMFMSPECGKWSERLFHGAQVRTIMESVGLYGRCRS